MTFPNFKDRKFSNRVIAAVVLLHFVTLMMAAHFDQPWLVQLAIYGTLTLYFVLLPMFWLWHRVTKGRPPVDSLSDIRRSFNETEWPPYDPRRYFALHKGIFAGLDDRRKPVYISWEDYNTTHMQVIGTTGAGKGVMSTMMLIQCALNGQSVIVFDPKNDKHAPNVIALAAKEAGLPFHLVDLRPETPPQINPFRFATYAEMKELLTTTFDLADKGEAADFYRLLDRRAARDVIRRAGSNPTIKRMLQVSDESPYITDEDAVAFQEKLIEMTELEAINTDEGPNLPELISTPGFFYIIGNIRSVESVQCQKLLLLRILQIIEKRPEELADRLPIALMLDEFKYILSPPALQALGTVRDKNCHVTLAHQSIGDLEECIGLDAAAVRGAVLENTGIKFIYRAKTSETAQWASELSGTIIAKTRRTDIQQSAFDAATAQYNEVERALLTINDIYAMPKLVGCYLESVWHAAARRHVCQKAKGRSLYLHQGRLRSPRKPRPKAKPHCRMPRPQLKPRHPRRHQAILPRTTLPSAMSLLPRTLAYEQSRRKATAVLSFLRTSIYSTEALLGQLMRIKDRATIHHSLVRLEQAGVIRRSPIRTAMSTVTLWGITAEGQQLATPPGQEANHLTFNISKVSVSRLEHYLSLQQIRITGEIFGWTEFVYCDRERKANLEKAESKYNVRPDLTARDGYGRRVAIECELCLKNPVRYKDNIIPGHIRRLNADEYDYVLWIARIPEDQQTLHQSLTARIQELKQEQRLHLTRTFTDYKMFQFANLQTWLNPQLIAASNGGQH